MARARDFKRSAGVTLVAAAAGAALFVATPSSAERTSAPAGVRETRAATPRAVVRAVRPSTQSNGLGQIGSARSDRTRATERQASPGAAMDDGPHNPWLLVLGALSVMTFLARRRRVD